MLVDPLAIISIHLESMPAYYSPAASVYQTLLPWFQANLVLVELDFNFLDENTQNNFEQRLNVVLDELINGDLKE